MWALANLLPGFGRPGVRGLRRALEVAGPMRPRLTSAARTAPVFYPGGLGGCLIGTRLRSYPGLRSGIVAVTCLNSLLVRARASCWQLAFYAYELGRCGASPSKVRSWPRLRFSGRTISLTFVAGGRVVNRRYDRFLFCTPADDKRSGMVGRLPQAPQERGVAAQTTAAMCPHCCGAAADGTARPLD